MAQKKRSTIKANPLDEIGKSKILISASNVSSSLPQDRNTAKPLKLEDKAKSKSLSAKEIPPKKTNQKNNISTSKNNPILGNQTLIDVQVDGETAEEIFSNSNLMSLRRSDKLSSISNKLKNESDGNFKLAMIKEANYYAGSIVQKYSEWAVLGGFITLKVLDTLVLTGIQIKMISELCTFYNVPFKTESARAIISSLVTGNVTTSVSHALGMEVAKKIPYIGKVLSLTVQPAISYASTHALGNIFIQHFENKGSLSNFNISLMKQSFQKSFDDAKAAFKEQRFINRLLN
jgi:uncharacterized protein (DUF697 family)